MDDFVNPIERMHRIAEEFGASREAMDIYKAGPLLDYEIVVGIFPATAELMCVPCARTVLGNEKVDWLLAQRQHEVEDADGNEYRLWLFEPFEGGDCERCGRPLMHLEPPDGGLRQRHAAARAGLPLARAGRLRGRAWPDPRSGTGRGGRHPAASRVRSERDGSAADPAAAGARLRRGGAPRARRSSAAGWAVRWRTGCVASSSSATSRSSSSVRSPGTSGRKRARSRRSCCTTICATRRRPARR